MNHKSMVYSNPVHRIIKNHPLKLMTPLRNFKFPSFFSYFSHNHLNRLAHSIDQIAFHSSMLMKYQNYRSLLQYQIKSMIITRIFFIFPLIITLHITIIVSCDLPLPFTVLFTFFPFPFILTLPFLTTLFSYQLTTISSTNTSIYFHQSDQISQFHLDQNHKHFSLPQHHLKTSLITLQQQPSSQDHPSYTNHKHHTHHHTLNQNYRIHHHSNPFQATIASCIITALPFIASVGCIAFQFIFLFAAIS